MDWEKEGVGGGGGNEGWSVGLRFVGQMTISSYRQNRRTLYFFAFNYYLKNKSFGWFSTCIYSAGGWELLALSVLAQGTDRSFTPLESLKKVPRKHALGIPYQLAPLAFMFAAAVLTFAL